MKIRFKKNVVVAPLSFSVGEELDLPESIAKAHISAGNAVAVKQPEFAVAPNAPKRASR